MTLFLNCGLTKCFHRWAGLEHQVLLKYWDWVKSFFWDFFSLEKYHFNCITFITTGSCFQGKKLISFAKYWGKKCLENRTLLTNHPIFSKTLSHFSRRVTGFYRRKILHSIQQYSTPIFVQWHSLKRQPSDQSQMDGFVDGSAFNLIDHWIQTQPNRIPLCELNSMCWPLLEGTASLQKLIHFVTEEHLVFNNLWIL